MPLGRRGDARFSSQYWGRGRRGSLTSRPSWSLRREFQDRQGCVETPSQNKNKRTGALLTPSSAEGRKGRARPQPFKLLARGNRPVATAGGCGQGGAMGRAILPSTDHHDLPQTSPIYRLLPSFRPHVSW